MGKPTGLVQGTLDLLIAARQQAAETPEPQMRGGTVDAVDDCLPLVGARSSTAVGGTLRMAVTS